MSALPYSQHPGMMPERAAGIWHEPAGDGYQWVDGPAERLPQVQAPQQPSQAPQPSVYPTQPQAGTQWVDNPTPPPVQDMVYQWVDSPSYGRPGAPAAAPVPPQQCVQAANPYYPGGDPYGALPRPMDPMALQPGIDPLRPPIQGLDPIAAQYQAGLAYGAQDANRFANPQAGMAPYAPRQPLGMDDLSSIRMGGKGVPAVDAFGQAGYHDGGKRGKGSGAQRRQVDDGRKGRQAVPPGRQVDGNKGQVDAGQAALESLGTDGLRQMLISTLESLYEDRIKPMANYIKGRLKERSVPDVIVKSFEDLYTQHPDLFEVQNPKCGEETTIYFHKAPTWFKGWIDIDSSQDPYDESMWKEFAKFLDGEHTFAGGRYGMARELMQRHLPFLANYSLGEVCHIVQLAIQHRRLIVYHRKMLKPIQTVLCQLSPDGADNTEGEEIKDMDDLMLALFRMLLHHPSGIRLCRMKQMIKHEFQRKLSEMAFQCTKLIELFNEEPLNKTFVLDTENDGKSIYVRLGNPETFSDHVKRIYAMANTFEAKQALPGLPGQA
ncbi:unnamed protein product [Durusdinium trenchii]|uniref:HTH OST-type domain-containing protein n=1 Tax=Durusdinium trenchii TaxID=1381693 RepID=A0ABP0MYU4_9DINO